VVRDHRPLFIKTAYLKWQAFYVRRRLRPQFELLGRHPIFIKPWYVEIFGRPVEVGDYATVIAAPDGRVRLSVWPEEKGKGRIKIGHYCMLCPGVRISSAAEVTIGDNCMFASRAYITDSDWHDIYNRLAAGKSNPVHIDANVWVGDSAIICKGVHLGENCVIGAGSVVVDDVPANTVAAGNPARVVKQLDPDETLTTRSQWFADPDDLFRQISQIDRQMLEGNTVRHWLRHLLFPSKGE
jgi:acetyltransferase-like isoleucine patch superfamily enzyme